MDTEAQNTRTGMSYIDFVITLVCFLFPLGWSMSGIEPNIALTCLVWGIGFLFLLHGVWKWDKLKAFSSLAKTSAAFTLLALIIFFAKPPVTKEWRKEHAKDYVVLIPVYRQGRWDFNIVNRGEFPVYNIKVQAIDVDRGKESVMPGAAFFQKWPKGLAVVSDPKSPWINYVSITELDPERPATPFQSISLSPLFPFRAGLQFVVTTRNRRTTEYLVMRFNGSVWQSTMRIVDGVVGKDNNYLVNCTDGPFPFPNNWNLTTGEEVCGEVFPSHVPKEDEVFSQRDYIHP